MRRHASSFRRPDRSGLRALVLFLAAVMGLPDASHADVFINSAVSGPQYGDGGSFILGFDGTITSTGDGVVGDATHGITQLMVQGSIDAADKGIAIAAGAPPLSFIAVTGTSAGGTFGLLHSGSAQQVSVHQGLVSGGSGTGIRNNGTIAYLDVGAPARVIGGGGPGIDNAAGASIGFLTMHGTLQGVDGLSTSGTIATLWNYDTGKIEGSNGGMGLFVGPGGGIGTFSSFGTVSGSSGVVVAGAVNSFLNEKYNAVFGTISGSSQGMSVVGTGSVTTLANAGIMEGGSVGLSVEGGHLGQFTNSGTIRSTTGGPALVVSSGGDIDRITNSGSIGDIVNASSIGDGTAAALTSTGTGASIGTFTNTGVVYGGMTVANQNLLIHGGGGNPFTTGTAGVFDGGTLTVSNGSLHFASGNTMLQADMVVSSAGGTPGAGTMTVDGTLIVVGPRALDGSFTLSPAGTFVSAINSSSLYGSLAATGTASFGGTLDLGDVGGAIAAGQTYDLFTFASRVGDFLGLSVMGTPLASLGGGQWAYGALTLSEIWTSTGMSLSVSGAAPIPEIDPAGLGSVLALASGALGLLERRRLKSA